MKCCIINIQNKAPGITFSPCCFDHITYLCSHYYCWLHTVCFESKGKSFQVACSLPYSISYPLRVQWCQFPLSAFSKKKISSASTFSLWETACEKDLWLDFHRAGSQLSDRSLKYSFYGKIYIYIYTHWYTYI